MICILSFATVPNATMAHAKCKIPLPFNGWTEACPHRHTAPKTGSTSLPSQRPPNLAQTYYRIRVRNACHEPIDYAIVYHTGGDWRHSAWYRIEPGALSGRLADVSFSADRFYYVARSASFVWNDKKGPSYAIGDRSYKLREKRIGGDFRDYEHKLQCSGN